MLAPDTYIIVKDETRTDEDCIQAEIIYGSVSSRIRLLLGKPSRETLLEADLLERLRSQKTNDNYEYARMAIITAKSRAGYFSKNKTYSKKPFSACLKEIFERAYNADTKTFNKNALSALKRDLAKTGLYFGFQQSEHYEDTCAFLATLNRKPSDISIQDQIVMNNSLELVKTLKAPHKLYLTSPELIAEFIFRGGIGGVLGGIAGGLKLHELAPATIRNTIKFFVGEDATRLQTAFIAAAIGLGVGCYKARKACVEKNKEIEKVQANERQKINEVFAKSPQPTR